VIKPVHSLLFVKSMPTMRLDDSKPACERAVVTCVQLFHYLTK